MLDKNYNTCITWQHLDDLTNAHIDIEIKPWLVDHDSLTKRLKYFCGDLFRVELLQQKERSPTSDEQTLLVVDEHNTLIERNVYLCNKNQPLVFARSLIPLSVIQGNYVELGQMGERPLGERLFNDSTLRRGQIEWCCINSGDIFKTAIQKIVNKPATIYGRRSLFYGAHNLLAVSEFFLPGIPRFSEVEFNSAVASDGL